MNNDIYEFDSTRAAFTDERENLTLLKCADCEITLYKDITGRTVEVMCPVCKGYDVEIVNHKRV